MAKIKKNKSDMMKGGGKYKCKGGCKKKAADGMVNQEVSPQGAAPPPDQGVGAGAQGQPAVSIMIQPVVNMNGQTQQLDQLTLQSKDDIPKLSQYLTQVFDTVMNGGQGGGGGGSAAASAGQQPQ